MKLYGSLTNRLQEGIGPKKPICEGDDITMYLWSDRYVYWVEKVENQKRIKVRQYYVCGNQEKQLGMGHQDWLYFKTIKEMNAYLNKHRPDIVTYDDKEPEAETWVYRYNKWMMEKIFTKENYCTEREMESLKKNGYYKRYSDLSGKISFGVKDYYYDWEF